MNSGEARKRPYDGRRRSEQSRLTRMRVLEAARDLLLADGYAAMTVPGLASRAGVSPQTVYNLIGGKAEVVKAVYDVTLAGDDDPTPMSERVAFRRVIEADDVASYAIVYASWARELWDRVGSLLTLMTAHGSNGDASLEEFIAKVEAERRQGNANSLRGLVERGVVPSGPPHDRLIDAVWTLTAPEVYHRLVGRARWSSADYERWLANQLAAALRD